MKPEGENSDLTRVHVIGRITHGSVQHHYRWSDHQVLYSLNRLVCAISRLLLGLHSPHPAHGSEETHVHTCSDVLSVFNKMKTLAPAQKVEEVQVVQSLEGWRFKSCSVLVTEEKTLYPPRLILFGYFKALR